MMKLTYLRNLIAACLALITIAAKAQYVSLSAAEISTLKKAIATDPKVQKQFAPIKSAAERALNETPNPIQKVTSQGLLEGNPAKTASLKAVQDGPKIYALALNYRLYGDKAYLAKAEDFLLAWAKLNMATGDPIDETKLEDFFTGYDLIRDRVNKSSKTAIDAWMKTIADAEVNSVSAKPGRSTAKNNWNSHRIKVITLAAYAIHDGQYRDTIQKELEKQIAQNLYPDGSGFDFAERDALHYHVYTLEPLLKAMTVIMRAEGKNYYDYTSPTGASVHKSVDFLVPFVTGERTHGEFVNSKVKFDRDRAANGEKGYVAGSLFEPRNGIVALAAAAYFDPSVMKAIYRAGGNDYYDWQLVINQVRKPIAKQ
ncbi:alginate lyase family protein [Mucilaginibacter sp. RS28]|uniref:Alginate lyase family protein n=1 Tax=Mucilaginibacter straminoryzae TaxID=2932774 RepID=A0A9X2B9B9_9SPHI|nr:alginate lyase family protein [Mucilaginibacter straminoryzae]MCJ8210449.1 alginate lyase family protein [Mucilaginibacter straminoryzae]